MNHRDGAGRAPSNGDAARPAEATAWLGLGTNLGDRRARLAAALRAIAALGTIEAVSPVYATAPIGYTAQPDFWNLVVRVRTALAPAPLLDAIKAAELRLGRTPTDDVEVFAELRRWKDGFAA